MTRARNGAAPVAHGRAIERSRPDKLTTRLSAGYVARLRRLAEEDGYSVAEWIETWVEMAESEITEFRQRPARRGA